MIDSVRGQEVLPGLPPAWVLATLVLMGLAAVWVWARPLNAGRRGLQARGHALSGPLARGLTGSPWPLVVVRLGGVALFMLVITSGFFGREDPGENLATVLTWTLWWWGVVLSALLLGSVWCAVCPWDALATWLARRRLWRRARTGLDRRLPRRLMNLWPALVLFVLLTWLELGMGAMTSPRLTAAMALLMLVLALASLHVFERKAFCRYFCPVGRTVGLYAQAAPLALRPIDAGTCVRCETLDCYHGNQEVEPCPTHLVMGRLRENTYCTSCGACALSCPYDNVSWRLRPPGDELAARARPRWDQAWFIVVLLAVTTFHGLARTVTGLQGLDGLGEILGTRQSLWSVTAALASVLLAIGLSWAAVVALSYRLGLGEVPYRRLFAQLAFTLIPLALSFHLAHQLSPLLYSGLLPFEVPAPLHFFLKAGLMGFGFWLALKALRSRSQELWGRSPGRFAWPTAPPAAFVIAVTLLDVWLLMQPLVL